MRRYGIIGTAGHVDHGKTQLVKALTGMDTDRLREEKKRGMTIDLGFAWLEGADGRRAGIVDVPGHERFIHNMLAGAGGMDVALLVIAADDGVMPQTREHLDILQLLGLEGGVIAITKADRVDGDWLELVKAEARALTEGTFLEGAPMAVVSARTGEGVGTLRALLWERLAAAARRNTARPFRLPVDRVFTVEGFGTVATGTLIEGTLCVGDEVEVYPKGLKSRARGMEVHAVKAHTAFAGQRVAVNLAGVKRTEVSRGDVLALPGSMQSAQMLDVRLTALKGPGRTLRSGSRLRLYHGARDMLCRLVLLGQDALAPGGEGYAQLRLAQPVAAKRGDPFIVRFYSPLETVGGGVVLDPNPRRHKKSDAAAREALRVRAAGTEADAVWQAVLEASPDFTPAKEIMRGLSMDPGAFGAALKGLVADGRAVRLSGRTVVARDFLDTLGRQAAGLLRAYHAEHPLRAGMRRDALRGKLMPGREAALADRVLSHFVEEGLIYPAGQRVALSGFQALYTHREAQMRDALMARLTARMFAPPAWEEMVLAFAGQDREVARRVWKAMVDAGDAVLTGPQVYFAGEAIRRAWETAQGLLRAQGQITLGQFRDSVGTSRKFALSLLEHFDRQGYTRRAGDVRVLAGKERDVL